MQPVEKATRRQSRVGGNRRALQLSSTDMVNRGFPTRDRLFVLAVQPARCCSHNLKCAWGARSSARVGVIGTPRRRVLDRWFWGRATSPRLLVYPQAGQRLSAVWYCFWFGGTVGGPWESGADPQQYARSRKNIPFSSAPRSDRQSAARRCSSAIESYPPQRPGPARRIDNT